MASFVAPRCFLSKAPRAHLFTQMPLRRVPSVSRHFADNAPPPFGLRGEPAPPRLPKEEQELFETLQRQSTGAFSTPRSPLPQINQSPDASPGEVADAESTIADRVEHVAQTAKSDAKEDLRKIIEAKGGGEELHPNVRGGAVPEFEGEKNPKTGEVGGPKNEPLRWGATGEWSYNGRTTDF